MATLFLRTDSSTFSGRGVPAFSITSAPAWTVSQSIWTPVASIQRCVAKDTSGPMPSPGMRVTFRLLMSSFLFQIFTRPVDDAADPFGDVLLARRETETHVLVGTKTLAGDHGHENFFEQTV